MPQATEEDRDKMIKRFGSIDPHPIIEWLESQGFVRDGYEVKSPDRELTTEELECLYFLSDEWDM
jgi:hypothetical protein